jgi:adenylate cyclase
MFADVKGSMELAEQLDPEEWSQIMSRFFRILSEGVERFEGFVDKFTGDGIMALFGAPIAHEDHAQRACYAALHLRDEIARYATEVKREHGVGFSTRMGINSGEVVVGKIGDDMRMDYTAQGHTVGLAQRMESIAEPNTCFLSEATAQLARGYFTLDDLGDFRIKGVTTHVRVFRLGNVGTARSRFDVSRARGFSCFVGRAADMRTLEDALDQAAAGNGQVVGVVAEAGTGKSRLCFEFLERCRARGIRVIEGRAVAHGRNIPFLPILEVFRGYYGITLEDDDRSAREKIAGRMMVLDQSLAPTLPLLYEFLGVGDPQNPAPQLDPDARQHQLIGVIRQIVRNSGTNGPTVTMIEDLHWLDDASAELLEHIVDARAGSHSLLLLNFRPEYRAEWMQCSWYRQVPLTPLGVEAIGELLADLLGRDPTVAALAGPVHRRTGGNPFFTEEVAQSLIETGHLEGTRGAYRLVTPVETLEVPATVQAVLAARIDRLPEREKRLLQIASVIGKSFPEPLLAAVADLPMDELKAALAALRRAEFVHEQSIYPVAEHAFKHPLTQEVALGSQLRERRRQTHAAVARAIESHEADHLDERSALLAHHWEEAGEALAAARWHKRAAEWVGRTDVAAAPRHWQRVRELRRALPDDREAARLGISACRYLLLALGFRAAADVDQARALLKEGQALAQAIGDQRASLYLSMMYGNVIRGDGDVATYLELAIENRRVAFESDDLAAQINASTYLVDAFELSGRFAEALQTVELEIARAPRHLPREEWAWGFNPHSLLRCFRAMVLTWVGRLREALEEWGRVLRMSEEDGTPEMTGYVLCFTARAHYLAGDADRALACGRQAEAISRGLVEHLGLTARVHLASAHADLAGGRPVDAVGAARSALDLLRRADKARAGEAATALAVALLDAGDLSAALSAAEEAIALCRRSLRAHHEAVAHGVLARALLRRDGAAALSAAEAALVDAGALIERTGSETLAPALCEWRAELAAVLGDEATRGQLLREAESGYREIGAPLQAARLRKELGT